MVIFTHDLDFVALLASGRAIQPSVLQVRARIWKQARSSP
jgi:hypothetical protein